MNTTVHTRYKGDHPWSLAHPAYLEHLEDWLEVRRPKVEISPTTKELINVTLRYWAPKMANRIEVSEWRGSWRAIDHR